jgi:hypothetical protein
LEEDIRGRYLGKGLREYILMRFMGKGFEDYIIIYFSRYLGKKFWGGCYGISSTRGQLRWPRGAALPRPPPRRGVIEIF